MGEGIVGLVAATGALLNLADAQNHPAFAYRPETGEEPFASMLAVPVRRGGRTLGVLVVQNRAPRHYSDVETEVLETVAMLLTELLAAVGSRHAGRLCRQPAAPVRCVAALAGHRVRPRPAARDHHRAANACWPKIPTPNWPGCRSRCAPCGRAWTR